MNHQAKSKKFGYGSEFEFTMPLLLLNDEEVVLKMRLRVELEDGEERVELEEAWESGEEVYADDPLLLANAARIEQKALEVFRLLRKVRNERFDMFDCWLEDYQQHISMERFHTAKEIELPV